MMRKRLLLVSLSVVLLALTAFPFMLRASIERRYQTFIFNVDDVPEKPVAIVFGAAVYRGGRLSSVLRDRMNAAIHLYKRGLVDRIIVSGHREEIGYDEPGSMRAYAVANGVPAEAIRTDNLGNRTYDTCYRASHVYGAESVILVSQDFHLPRALYTCSRLGLDAVGVRADGRQYRGAQWYELRETAAMIVAFADLIRSRPPANFDPIEEESRG